MLIGVLAARAGLTAKTLRYYEDAGLLPRPPRTTAGYRDYPSETVWRLAFIRDAKAAGLTLAEISSVLAIRDGGLAPCRHVTGLVGAHLAQVERRLTELTQARDVLRDLQRRAAAADPADCASQQEVCSILATPGSDSGPADRPAGRAAG